VLRDHPGSKVARPKKARTSVRLNPKQREILERQREKFLERFGREPGPADPIFFDPSIDDPRPLDPDGLVATIAAAMERADGGPAPKGESARSSVAIASLAADIGACPAWSAGSDLG